MPPQHWPSSTDPDDPKKHLPDWDFVRTWAEMQKLPETGKVRAIGVSNFSVANLEKLLGAPTTKIVPAVNQVELHPGNQTPRLVAYCRSRGIHCTGYSCLGSRGSPLASNEVLGGIADRKGKTTAQVLIMWGLQKGWSVIPKSVTPSRIESNFDLDGWSLDQGEMEALDGLKSQPFKVCGDSWLPIRVFDPKDQEEP
jgi:glycerol 2-dehydrogenase (NADP+)